MSIVQFRTVEGLNPHPMEMWNRLDVDLDNGILNPMVLI